jgi:citrate lyase subunit beta/citryl-CoA lyase
MKLRTLLFAPGDSPRKVTKALGLPVDTVILDLEDSVAAPAKESARVAAASVLADHPDRLIVRINPAETHWYLGDLGAVVPRRPAAIMLPKCSSPDDLRTLARQLDVLEAAFDLPRGKIGVLPLATETAASLRNMDYAGVTPRLRALAFGAEDLSADLGVTPRGPDGSYAAPVEAARAALLVAAAAAGVPAVDTPWPDPRDLDGLAREARGAVRDGFAGKLCIHPDQIGPVAVAFTPAPERLAWARSVRELFASSTGSGVLTLNGKMIDRPHLRLAERLLAAGD